MRYDLKGHFYFMEKFCDIFTFRLFDLFTTLTYILMDNFCSCFFTHCILYQFNVINSKVKISFVYVRSEFLVLKLKYERIGDKSKFRKLRTLILFEKVLLCSSVHCKYKIYIINCTLYNISIGKNIVLLGRIYRLNTAKID